MRINDDRRLLSWLGNNGPSFRQIICYRCAMRVAPFFFHVIRRTDATERFALFGLRALLTLSVTSIGQKTLPDAVLLDASKTADFAGLAEGARSRSSAWRSGQAVSVTAPGYAVEAAASAISTVRMDASEAFASISFAARALADEADGIRKPISTRWQDAFASEVSADIQLIEGASSGRAIVQESIQLTPSIAEQIKEWCEDRSNILGEGGSPWTFWAKWYDRAMAGDPLPWDLQEQVALIPDAVWKDGPEAVAAEIDRIEAAFELRQRIAEVEADQLLINERRLGIGGNNPPEEIDDPETVQQVVILWESIAGLKEEVEANEPDAERVAALIERLGAALKAVIAWCGRKGDLIVDTTIKSTIGWALPAASGGYFILNPAKAEAVLKAAQSWLPFLAP